MKDKLVHTGHKKLYYRLRNIGIALLIAVGVAGLSAMPIALTYTFTEVAAHADNEQEQKTDSTQSIVDHIENEEQLAQTNHKI